MHILLDNFHQGGKYTAQIASKQAQLRREVKFTDQKYLSVSSLQTDYLNLDRILDKSNERENIVQVKFTFVEISTQQKMLKKEKTR